MTKQLSLDSFEDIKLNFDIEFSNLQRMISKNEVNYATHNLLPYPSKFIPQFPKVFINYFSKPKMKIFDPMCGAGTTLIESALNNRIGYGSDINHIARLISRVSTTPIKTELLKNLKVKLLKNLKVKFSNISKLYSKIDLPNEQNFPNYEIWFREDVLKELIIIHNDICAFEDLEFRDFARLCLYSIVKPVSNADPRDLMPERDLENPIRERKNVFKEFKLAINKNTRKLIDFSTEVKFEKRTQVFNFDARDIKLSENEVDLVITSPPYAYALDYPRVFKLISLLFIFTNEELRKSAKLFIGNDKISKKEKLDTFNGIENMENLIKGIYEKDKKIGLIIYHYFQDINKVTSELYRVIKKNNTNNKKNGSYLIYIIGNSTIRKTKFRTSDFLIEICKNNGFEIEKVLERPYYAYRMARKRANHSNIIKSDLFIIAKKK